MSCSLPRRPGPVAAARFLAAVFLVRLLAGPGVAAAESPLASLPLNTWVKLSPLAGTPPSPRLGYEGACVWDRARGVLVRYGGHNQGGGGEQGSELWTFEPLSARWRLHETDTSPPGICCGQQNVFDPVAALSIRFPAFSGNHGWQWFREIYLNDSPVWVADPGAGTWRDRRPVPAPHPRPLRCASWDSDHQVIVLFGGEGSREGTQVYDPWANTWHAMCPEREPAFRSGGNMAYDAARKVHVLFGSQFSDDPHTWAYDLRKNEWRDMKPPELPPADRNDAVLAYDSRNEVVLALVKITTGEEEKARHRLETWAYDAGPNRWRRMAPGREPDPSGNRARQLMYAPGLDVFLVENRTHAPQGPPEQQIWAYRYGPGRDEEAVLEPPSRLEVRTAGDAVTLSWRASRSPGVVGYAVYRGCGERPWEAELREIATVPAEHTTFTDRGLPAGETFHYAVRAAGSGGRLSAESVKGRAQPPVVEEVVVSVLSPRRVEVSWKPPRGEPEDIAGYLVERAPVEVLSEDQLRRLKSRVPPLAEPAAGAVRRIGAFRVLSPEPVVERTFTDDTVDLERPVVLEGDVLSEERFAEEHLDPAGKPYRFAVYGYRVRARNRLGVTGGPSPVVFTLPSAPRRLFAREEGRRCRLRWAPNPEKGLAGYRVYRLDGRWDSDPIRRLTVEPLGAVELIDPEAGEATRRYHVVAVDRLGQEGRPSAPVWHLREWRRFYAPFTGEWHQ